MSDQTTTGATAAPPPTAPNAPTPASPAPVPPSAAPVADPAEVRMTSAQLKARLDETRAAALRELGFATADEAKAAAAAAKAAAEASKTAEQRAAEALAEKGRLAAEHEATLAIVREHAGRQLGALTDEQKAAVAAIAGDDPRAQLKAIDALRPTWGAQPPPAPIATAPTAAASTAPPPNAPAGQAPAVVDHAATYRGLKATNPIAAAAFLRRHVTDIYPEKR